MNAERLTKILIVDDDPGHLATLKTITRSWGYAVLTADDGIGAVELVKSEPVDLVLMDVRMAKMSGIEALEKITAYNPSIPVIIMTAYSSVESAVEALKTGAYDYLIKPLDFEVLKRTLERAHDHAGLRTENRLLKEQLRADLNTTNIIGKSRAMKELLEMLAMDMLIWYDWPGNVRELENIVERAVILMTGEHVTEKQLPMNIAREQAAGEPAAFTEMAVATSPRSLEEIEKEAILRTLEATDGNKSETARRLGITRKTLHKKLKNYGIG